ncbi:MAG: hypothetical protein KA163_05020 [Bacteroidia bacterium]|nr:hypothetical protein [Bacteroidia bacterium]
MKQIKPRKGVRILNYLLQYLSKDHKLFFICKDFEPGKYAVKAVNEKGSSETVVAVCNKRKLAREIITQDLEGRIVMQTDMK